MELQICQVLNKKESELWWLPRLENKSNCIHVLEDQVMKEISLGKGLIWKIFNPKGVKTWEAKSGIVQSDLWLPSLDNHVQLYSYVLEDQVQKDIILSWV